jgi:penicillin-binding protein 1B
MGILTGMSEHGQAGPPGRPKAPPAHARLRQIARTIQPHLTAIGIWARGLEPKLKRLGKRRVILLGVLLAVVIVGGISLAIFGARVQALRERHATGPSWAFPSLVFADGVPLTPGRPLPREYLLKHLAAREYQEVELGSGASRGLVSELPEHPGTFAWTDPATIVIALRGFDAAMDPDGYGGAERVRLTLRDGALARVERLGALPGALPPDMRHAPRLEPWPIAQLAGTRDVRRTWVPLSRIPIVVQQAVIASEDRRFRQHFGLDLRGNVRALLTNMKAGGVRQGGSTITQQLARGLFFGRERTLGRKVLEGGAAVGLEVLLSKEQILEMYLNSVYWGQGEGRGVAGVAEAARWYFDEPVDSLTLNEAALLAGLIPSPNVYSPFKNPKLARERRNSVLSDMVESGVLDAKTAARMRARPLSAHKGTTRSDRFPSFVDFAGTYLEAHIPKEAPRRWGLSIFTTADLVWQPLAEEAVSEGLNGFDPRRNPAHDPNKLEGAFIAIEPHSGAIRALVGGRVPMEGDFNRATQAQRQSGSSIKPIVYAAALATPRGDSVWTAASTVPNLPRTFRIDDQTWSPANADYSYSPRITLERALARSVNMATINLVEAIGPETVVRFAERFGLGKLKPVLSIGLGSNEVTLIDLVDAYTVFPADGLRQTARPVRAAVDARGLDLLAPPPPAVRVLTRGIAGVMVKMLEDVVQNGISSPLVWAYNFTRPVGGKTGTTNDNKDAWFVGFVPDLAAGMWVGYDTPRGLGHSAAGIALPIWARVMNALLEDFPPAEFPPNPDVEEVSVDGITGGLPRPDCPQVFRAPFAVGTAPTWTCRRNHDADWVQMMLAQMARDSLAALADSLGAEGDTTGSTDHPPFQSR